MWPLNYYFFNDWHLKAMFDGGNLGMFMLVLGYMIFIISPILTYFFTENVGTVLGFVVVEV
jgi:hypothetical protein